MKKFAVVLSGSGVFDGAEIHEATLTLLAIHQQGGEYEIFAPDIPHHHVINHLTGEEMPEQRNVLVESARIARGKITDLKDFNPDQFDAIIFPGGFGVAKNLSTVAFDGPNARINHDVELAVKGMLERGKPIGALCISPAMIARIIGDVKVTIGQDEGTIKAITKMGGTHVETTHGEVVQDEQHKVFTTPCYMLDANISQIADGANNVVKEIIKVL
ncbi:MAG: isoprenoid biosynthesis glyoxalase ElbB [Bacteroidota bacterium]|nr:isoprenoid biosynthesis glyoxalase ElbB [Bacteroidota bacterium]